MTVHIVLPNDIDDPAAPSGGNLYDRRLIAGLTALGWTVREHPVAGSWPSPSPQALSALARVLESLPDGALAVVDGLIASCVPASLFERLRAVVLVHMPLRTPNEQEVLSRVQAVVTTSSWTRELLVRLYAIPASRITPALPGVDAGAIVPGSAGGRRLLCVAAVAPHKGHDVLVSALARIGDLPWECVCVGALDCDPEFVASLGTLPGLSFAGPLTRADLDAAFTTTDLVVLPSRGETYGMVVTEALARGIPVLATGVGGVPEALGRAPDGSRPGILVPPDDPDAMASALRSWLTDARLRESLHRSASARRPELPGWDSTAATVASVLSTMEHFPAPETFLAGDPLVSPAWLGLREAADASARSLGVLGPLRRRFVGTARLLIHDLGCGTGSMARWLAPKLPGPQRWILHDRDPELLERAAIDVPGKAWDGSAVTVETRLSDITRLTTDDLAGADLVTASALLDMLTLDELDSVAAACAGRPALFTISVAGRVRLTPADPLDDVIGAAFNDHQRRAAFGRRLLGPDAAPAVVAAFERRGVETAVLPSPWRLGADDADLIAEWLLGWVAAACEHDPALDAAGQAYAHRRLAQAAAGALEVEVHHEDVLAGWR
jgi:glycosyltransferase involved in cell wall biosynthesis/SAM-dependent methyltransferase